MSRARRHGFTLVEMLVHVSLFALVTGPLVLVWVQTDRVVSDSQHGLGSQLAAVRAVEALGRDIRAARRIKASGRTVMVGGAGAVHAWSFVAGEDRRPATLLRSAGEGDDPECYLLPGCSGVSFRQIGGDDRRPGLAITVTLRGAGRDEGEHAFTTEFFSRCEVSR